MYLRCKDLDVFEQRASLLLKMRGLQTPLKDPKTPQRQHTPVFTVAPASLEIPSMFEDKSDGSEHALMVPEMFGAGV